MFYEFEEFKMPALWDDEETIYQLCQIPRPRHINSAEYDKLVDFWIGLIRSYAKHHHLLVINEEILQHRFKKVFNDGDAEVPKCFPLILHIMYRQGLVKRLEDWTIANLLHKTLSVSYYNFIRKPVQWTWSALVGTETWNDANLHDIQYDSSTNFLLIHELEDMKCRFIHCLSEAKKIRIHHDFVVFMKADFESSLTSFIPDLSSRDAFRKMLLEEKVVSQIELLPKSSCRSQPPIELVALNFLPKGIQGNHFEGVAKLDEKQKDMLLAVVELRRCIEKIRGQEENILLNIQKDYDEIKRYLQTKQRKLAENRLIGLKRRQKILEEKSQQGQNLSDLLLQIENCSDNAEMLTVLETTRDCLKSMTYRKNSKSGDMSSINLLDVADDVMADIVTSFDQLTEANSAFGQLTSEEIDSTGLEEELKSLLKIDENNDKTKATNKDTLLDKGHALDKRCLSELPDVSGMPHPKKALLFDQ